MTSVLCCTRHCASSINGLQSVRFLKHLAWKSNTLIQPQPYKYFLVIDIESTCDVGFASLPVQVRFATNNYFNILLSCMPGAN